MAGELKKSTQAKLDPNLVLFLGSLQTALEQSERTGFQAATSGLLANFLNAIQNITERTNLIPPVTSNSNLPDSTDALESQIARAVANYPELGFVKARQDPKLHDSKVTKHLVKMPDLIGKFPKGLNAKELRIWKESNEALYRDAVPKEKLFLDPLKEPIESIRSNRDPRRAFEKFTHRFILTFLFLFGALRKTGSNLSRGVLSNDELKDVFDVFCPACRKPHKAETMRKSAERFANKLLRNVTAGKNRKARSIEIRHSMTE